MAGNYPHVERGLKYAEQVVAGEIDACKWVKLACKRQLDDLKRWKTKRARYHFDEWDAEGVCDFISKLKHVKGEWARGGQEIYLEPWQCFRLATVYGWKRKDGTRRFRTSYTEVPRKNAKTTIGAGEMLFLGFQEGEPGAEVYSAAVDREQAGISWKVAGAMVRAEPELQALPLTVQRDLIKGPNNAIFRPLSRDTGGHDGLNIHAALIDELHAHKTREMLEVIETGTGSRSQPLLVIITTAGSNRAGICYEQRSYVTKILEGVVKDETYWGIIYTIDDGDRWDDPTVWAKANPNYGISVDPDDLERKAAKARTLASAQPGFLTKHLNVWVNADQAWMDMRRWDAQGDPHLSIDDFEGCPCWIGVDLASKIDLAAVAILFERGGKRYLFRKLYLPEEAVEGSRNSQYQGWARQGILTVTDGGTLDFDVVEADVIDLATRFRAKVGVDEFQATQFVAHLQAAIGEERALIYPQRLATMSEPMKQLEADIYAGKLFHEGCPAMAWQISNVVCHRDAKDNIYPRKEREEAKIDGPVAAIIALGMAMRDAPAKPIDVGGLMFA